MPINVIRKGPMTCAQCGVRGIRGFSGTGTAVYCPEHAYMANVPKPNEGKVGVSARNTRWNMGDGSPQDPEDP
tara:strand:+ start:574 stop:792 length:219 start_codon:yes stop_codon:yes gene_type:complete